jgi:cytochrome c
MKQNYVAVSFAASFAAIAAAMAIMASGGAVASEELAKKTGCAACHSADKKMVGPSYKDIAAKYKAAKNAEAMLAGKIKNGSSGVWGAIPMAPTAGLSDADALALAKWVMTQ